MKEKIDALILLVLVVAYTYMVIMKIAPVDGYAVLAAMVIKHRMDLSQDESDAKIEQNQSLPPTPPKAS